MLVMEKHTSHFPTETKILVRFFWKQIFLKHVTEYDGFSADDDLNLSILAKMYQIAKVIGLDSNLIL